MNLKEALKAAIDGAKIRHSGWPDGAFFRWNNEYMIDDVCNFWRPLKSEVDSDLWEIIPEPVKYSVDVWLQKIPKVNRDGGPLEACLFNQRQWSLHQSAGTTKYRITVEEVAE